MKRKGSEAVSVWAMVKATAVHLFKSESNLSDVARNSLYMTIYSGVRFENQQSIFFRGKCIRH